MLHEPVYNVLRTREQLGYSVSCNQAYVHGVLGFNVSVASDRHPADVETRIETFLGSAGAHISGLSTAEYNEHVHSLVSLKMEAPKSINEVADRHWAAVFSGEYGFLTRYEVRRHFSVQVTLGAGFVESIRSCLGGPE